MPILAFSLPELPLYKNVEYSGHAEIKISITDAQTGEFVDNQANCWKVPA
jgi:hypothetical protein